MASLFHTPSYITITCHNRLSDYLAKEVKALGYELLDTFLTGVVIRGDLNDCIRLNIHLRCASQVLYSLMSFNARNADQVYEAAKELPWEEIIGQNPYFSITSNVRNKTINNNLFANLRVKDAIMDYYKEEGFDRPETGSDLIGAVIHLHWEENEAELFLNTSGPSLGRHGYRKIPGQAPMLEALAAATILASNWKPGQAFVNPMCGSGTLAIEAALIASNTPPGLFRIDYAFMHLMGYDEAVYYKEVSLAEEKIIEKPNTTIIASDMNPTAIENAKKNAIAAGIKDWIQFEVCDFAETSLPNENKGVLFMNPEYGLRLGDVQDLEATYKRIGDFFKNEGVGYTGYIFTGNLELAKKIGLKAKRRIPFFNSKIDCRLLEYELYEGTKNEK